MREYGDKSLALDSMRDNTTDKRNGSE